MLQFLNSAEEVGTNFKVMVMSLRNRRLESVGGGVFFINITYFMLDGIQIPSASFVRIGCRKAE
jgi:hypothetical protein